MSTKLIEFFDNRTKRWVYSKGGKNIAYLQWDIDLNKYVFWEVSSADPMQLTSHHEEAARNTVKEMLSSDDPKSSFQGMRERFQQTGQDSRI